MWYITQVTLQDEDAQLKGFVAALYSIGTKTKMDRVTLWKALQLAHVFPTRYVAMHFCYDNPNLKWMISVASTVFETRTRTRFRCHYGTNVECIYKLMTFGIPSDILPVTSAGKLRLDFHREFLKTQKAREKQQAILENTQRIVVPESLDVLLGRGRTFRSNPGNVRFHNVIDKHFERYEQSNRTVKLVLSEEVVIEIKKLGSRFLKQTETGWIQVDDDFARVRVAHAFRNRRLSAKAAAAGGGGRGNKKGGKKTLDSFDGGLPASILSRPLVDAENSCLLKRRKLMCA